MTIRVRTPSGAPWMSLHSKALCRASELGAPRCHPCWREKVPSRARYKTPWFTIIQEALHETTLHTETQKHPLPSIGPVEWDARPGYNEADSKPAHFVFEHRAACGWRDDDLPADRATDRGTTRGASTGSAGFHDTCRASAADLECDGSRL